MRGKKGLFYLYSSFITIYILRDYIKLLKKSKIYDLRQIQN
jgi:hypothetical protein